MTQTIDMRADRRTATLLTDAWQWLRKRFGASRYQGLHGLDAVTLKDIGIDRSEISSVDAELYSGALRTRRNLAWD